MTALVRLLLLIAAPIAAFLVGRDSLQFGMVEALIVMVFISLIVGWIAWIIRKDKSDRPTAG